jgi:hypothetical protein
MPDRRRRVESALPAGRGTRPEAVTQSSSMIVTVAEAPLPSVQPEDGRDRTTSKVSGPSVLRSFSMVIETVACDWPGLNPDVNRHRNKARTQQSLCRALLSLKIQPNSPQPQNSSNVSYFSQGCSGRARGLQSVICKRLQKSGNGR